MFMFLRLTGKFSFYFVNLLPYLLYLAFVTLFVMTSPNPISHPQFYNCSEYFNNINSNGTVNGTNNSQDFQPEHELGNQTAKIILWVLTALFVLKDILQDKHMVLINAIVYLDIPWTFILDYVLYVLVIYVTAGSEVGYDILGSSEDNNKHLRTVCLMNFSELF